MPKVNSHLTQWFTVCTDLLRAPVGSPREHDKASPFTPEVEAGTRFRHQAHLLLFFAGTNYKLSVCSFYHPPIQLCKQGEEKYKDHLRKPLRGVWLSN